MQCQGFAGQNGEVSYSLANLASKDLSTVIEQVDLDAPRLYEDLKHQVHVTIDYCHTLVKEAAKSRTYSMTMTAMRPISIHGKP